jgi:anti-sigma factor RsiW
LRGKAKLKEWLAHWKNENAAWKRRIDALLSAELDLPTDDGFREKVMASLPPRCARHTWVLPAGAAAGALLAATGVAASRLPLFAMVSAAVGMLVLAALWALCEAERNESPRPG